MTEEQVELIKYRLEQSESSLKDAAFLLENKRSGFSVINRCYYAIFYSVLALLVDQKFIGSKHSGVIAFFDKEFINNGIFHKKYSKIFHKAFDMRVKSDYKEFIEYPDEKIKLLLSQAKEFVNEIKNFIVKGIK